MAAMLSLATCRLYIRANLIHIILLGTLILLERKASGRAGHSSGPLSLGI